MYDDELLIFATIKAVMLLCLHGEHEPAPNATKATKSEPEVLPPSSNSGISSSNHTIPGCISFIFSDSLPHSAQGPTAATASQLRIAQGTHYPNTHSKITKRNRKRIQLLIAQKGQDWILPPHDVERPLLCLEQEAIRSAPSPSSCSSGLAEPM